jgi:DNA primase
MAQWVDFDYLKTQVSMKDVLGRYGLLHEASERKTARGVELRMRCPFHEEQKPSFTANVETGRFHCFGCEAKGGDIFDFVALKEGIATDDRTHNRRQAALKVQEWFGISSPRAKEQRPKEESSPPGKKTFSDRVQEVLEGSRKRPRSRRHKPAKEEEPSAAADVEGPQEHIGESTEDTPVNPPLPFAFKNLDHRHPYLLKDRGLSEETIEVFGLGYHAGKGIMAGRVVIPIHNEVGELVAYAGRWPGDEGWPEGEDKYKLPPGFRKSLVLFNLHRAREHAGDGLIVVEGFFDVFLFWQRGRKNVVALMGSSMSEAQERLIVETVGARGRVLLALDGDEAGRKGSADAVHRLAPQVFVREMAL